MTDDWEAARKTLCETIAQEVRDTARFIGKDALDPKVLAAMARVPRHLFVPARDRRAAYDNRPLPIGEGQTISQPFIVALMTDLSEARPGQRVLDVGSGSGYQAAVLAELGCRVYGIERLQSLCDRAARNLAQAGYGAVRLRCGNGLLGWPEAAPFDAILVAAAWRGRAPAALLAQLRAPGNLVIPLARPGPFGEGQILTRFRKDPDGKVTEQGLLPVAFVPLIGESQL